jgi:hypothetical protein
LQLARRQRRVARDGSERVSQLVEREPLHLRRRDGLVEAPAQRGPVDRPAVLADEHERRLAKPATGVEVVEYVPLD